MLLTVYRLAKCSDIQIITFIIIIYHSAMHEDRNHPSLNQCVVFIGRFHCYSTHKDPSYSDHPFLVPRMVFVGNFDCTLS